MKLPFVGSSSCITVLTHLRPERPFSSFIRFAKIKLFLNVSVHLGALSGCLLIGQIRFWNWPHHSCSLCTPAYSQSSKNLHCRCAAVRAVQVNVQLWVWVSHFQFWKWVVQIMNGFVSHSESNHTNSHECGLNVTRDSASAMTVY